MHLGNHRVFAGGMVAHLDADGNLERTTLKSIKHEGSDSTSIQIRCDGKTVNVSGNVGRFNRPDNVFNYDLECTMTLINNILESLDIPPFTSGERIYHSYKNKVGEIIDTVDYTGAKFSELHCTDNYSTGSSESAKDFLYNAGMVKPGRQKVQAYETGAGYGYGSRYQSGKVYNKAEDLKRLVKSGKLPNNQYIQNLIQWCEEQGMVRAEMEYKNCLRRHNLSYWGEVTHIDLEKHFKKDEIAMIKDTEIFDVDKLTRTFRTTYYDYINGVNLKYRMKKETFYRHRRELLKYGIDIAVTVNVQRLPVQTKIIEISPCIERPDFYFMPEVKPWSKSDELSRLKIAS